MGISASDSTESAASTVAPNQPNDLSGLSDQSLFRHSNIKVVADLINFVQTITSKFQSILPKKTSQPNLKAVEDHICLATMHYNRKIEYAFHIFWSEILLREIPANIWHYPSSNVISFDVRAALTNLLHLAADAEIERQYGYKRRDDQRDDREQVRLTSSNILSFLSYFY